MKVPYTVTKEEKRKMSIRLAVRLCIAAAIFATAYRNHGLAYMLGLMKGGAVALLAGALLCYAFVFASSALDYGIKETARTLHPAYYVRNFLWEMLFDTCPDNFGPEPGQDG